ncbi:10289_t:CDS:2 [Entrophospora sp. SA101]|nr:10289_t:CDS:2 [Entrophospora sp. SA101]
MNNNDELTSLQTNNHLRRKIGRPRKPIWQHFTEIGSSNNNNNNKRPGAKCNYCGQQWACGKSSDMISHIALSCTKPPPPDICIKFQNKKTITNEKQLRYEIKSAYQELNETEFEQVVIQSNLHFSELINVDDEELQNVLGIEVSVVIPPYEIIEHGDPEFDVESIVDNLMTRRSKGSNQNVNVTNE